MATKSRLNTLEYDESLCSGCGSCSAVCPHGVFALDGDRARLVKYEACMECGACQVNCPTGAIKVDSGVGCATAYIWAALRGKKVATCGSSRDETSEADPGCCGPDEGSSCCCG